MTQDYDRATPEQWAIQNNWRERNDPDAACILELRARVEAD